MRHKLLGIPFKYNLSSIPHSQSNILAPEKFPAMKQASWNEQSFRVRSRELEP